jgi:hypothetical protein
MEVEAELINDLRLLSVMTLPIGFDVFDTLLYPADVSMRSIINSRLE